MGDQRIALFKDAWFEQNRKVYGHTPFNWTGKHAKLVKGLFQQVDAKNINHKLVYKAVEYYFKLDGFEKTISCHSFGQFYNNFQRYIQAVMSTVARDQARPAPKPEPKADPNALRKTIQHQGPKYVEELYRVRRFMPLELLKKSTEICIELFGRDRCAKLIDSTNRASVELDRKQQLLDQAKRLKEKD